MSGRLEPSIPYSCSIDCISFVSHRSKMRLTHLIKCSGVLPVGREITPPGFFKTHSINRRAESFPRRGKLSTSMTSIFSVGEYRSFLPIFASSTLSTGRRSIIHHTLFLFLSFHNYGLPSMLSSHRYNYFMKRPKTLPMKFPRSLLSHPGESIVLLFPLHPDS